ncbi:MAG: gliding motility-associated C-terminal domain-containing protein [Chryseolinea sp.]
MKVLMYKGNFFLLLLLMVSAFNMALADPTPGYQFIENKNQWPYPIQYATSVPGGKLYVQSGVFTYFFLDESKLEHGHRRTDDSEHKSNGKSDDGKISGHRLQVSFDGARTDITPFHIGRSDTYYNYFIGRDTCNWASFAYAYQGVLYQSIYAGIDLKLYNANDNLKYDFIVAPLSDPSHIQLSYDGSDQLFVDASGDLHVGTSVTQIIEKKPVAFQIIDGRKVYIACKYVLKNKKVSFSFPDGYDPCYELTIDPLLIFSTYSGSTADNWGSTATPGEHGNLYSGGVTNQTQTNGGGKFPATNGAFQTNYGGLYDVAILKYDSAGTKLLYASYLGGSDNESAHSLVVNNDGDLLVLGTTSSANFPTSTSAYDRSYNGGVAVNNELVGSPESVINYDFGSDIFVALISEDGSKLKSSTFLGGSQNDGLNFLTGPLTRNYGDQMRGDIIADALNNVYISTVTSSSDFPIVGGLGPSYNGGSTDALIVKLNADLSGILWSTFLGGSLSDASYTIQFDKSGDIFVAGGTNSPNFPTTSGSYQPLLAGGTDGWIANISSDGTSVINSTLTGTSNYDQIYFIDLNKDNEVYVYGQTAGNIPVTPGVYNNPGSGQFLQKFDQQLKTLQFSTVLGSGSGIPDISPTAFLVNDCNNIYLTGWGGLVNSVTGYWNSNTIGLPVTQDAFKKTTNGSDLYFMVLTDDASEFLYGTFMGGSDSRTHVDGGTSRFDKGGIVYHAVCSGCDAYNAAGHSTSDFPTTTNAWSRVNKALNCNNAAFKFDLSSLKARLQSNSIKLDFPGLSKICIPDPIVFQNFSTGGETFEWDLGDGTKIVKHDHDTSMVVHQYLHTGQYKVKLKAIDKGTCIGSDSVFTIINVFIAETKVQDDDDVCLGTPYKLQASGGATYVWTTKDGSFRSTLATPTVSPADTTQYYVTVTEATGCYKKDTVQLDVIPIILPSFEYDQTAECFNRPMISFKSTTDSLKAGDRLFFDFGDGNTSDDTVGVHEFKKDGLYNVKLVAVRESCVTEVTIPIPVFKLLIPNVITPISNDGLNDKFVIQYGDVAGVTPLTYGFKTELTIYNRWGNQVYHSDDYHYDWAGDGLEGGVYYYDVTVEGHAVCKSWVHLMK